MTGPIALQISLILLNAIFAGAEIAVISLNEARMQTLCAKGEKGAKRLWNLTKHPAKFLATIQVAITLAGLLGSAFAAESFAEPMVNQLQRLAVFRDVSQEVLKSAVVILITMILAYFNLVFGELVPKRIAMSKAEKVALAMSGILGVVSKIFAPLVFLLTASTNLILKILGMDPSKEEEQVSQEEIKVLLAQGQRQGSIDEGIAKIAASVLAFDRVTVGQLCIHRTCVTYLDLADSMETWEKILSQSGHTFYPVCEGSIDAIKGILDCRRYFHRGRGAGRETIERLLEEPLLVSSYMRAETLLQQMNRLNQSFAVVIDEYGGFEGIITIKDIYRAMSFGKNGQ